MCGKELELNDFIVVEQDSYRICQYLEKISGKNMACLHIFSIIWCLVYYAEAVDKITVLFAQENVQFMLTDKTTLSDISLEMNMPVEGKFCKKGSVKPLRTDIPLVQQEVNNNDYLECSWYLNLHERLDIIPSSAKEIQVYEGTTVYRFPYEPEMTISQIIETILDVFY